MRKQRFLPHAAIAVAIAFVAAAAIGAMSVFADEPVHEKHTMVRLAIDGDDPDTIVIEDLHDLEVGESRSFTTEAGKIAVATRTEKGIELDVDGKKISIGAFGHGGGHGDAAVWHVGAGEHADGDQVVFEKRIEIADDASGKAMVWHSESGEGPGRIHVIKKLGHGDEPSGFAFTTGDEMLIAPFGAKAWIDRLEKTESFQQLDEATREVVRRAMREAARVEAGPGVMVIDIEEKEP